MASESWKSEIGFEEQGSWNVKADGVAAEFLRFFEDNSSYSLDMRYQNPKIKT